MYVLVQPDVLKVEKCYWYKADDQIIIGDIVRVFFNGRKVRAWVIEISLAAPNDLDDARIKQILEFVSCGPNNKMVDFSFLLAKYYLVSPVVFLRMCSPSVKVARNIIQSKSIIERSNLSKSLKVIYVDPRANRRELILNNIAKSGSTIIITPDGRNKFAKLIKDNNHNVIVIDIDGKVSKDSYLNMAKGNCVVISSRKAIFANVPDLASIIVLDDGFEQLRDERTPKFHSVDIAKLRAEKEQTDLTVITSVPTVVTHDLAVRDMRTKDTWPKIYIEDLSKSDPTLGSFTHKIVQSIKLAHEIKCDVAIISNNVTLARKLICNKCQSICVCDNCGHNVIMSEANSNLECEICKTTRAVLCSKCGSVDLKKYRKGTKSLVTDIQKLIPSSSVIEVEKQKNINYEDLKDKENKIFIGTENIFHQYSILSNIGLVIFLDFDSYLLRPRADAFEQSLISVNRALRVLKHSDLLVSLLLNTRMADHEIIRDMQKSDYVSHLSRDLELKKELGAAPYRATAQIKVKNEDFDELLGNLENSLVDGFIEESDSKILAISTKNHDELTRLAYKGIRSFAANHRLSLSVDTYE